MDIKISLEIGLSPQLAGFLTKALGGVENPTRNNAQSAVWGRVTSASASDASDNSQETTSGVVLSEASQPEGGEHPQDEAPKRTRRTKAQMEADAASTSGSQEQTDAGTSEPSLTEALDAADGEAPTIEDLKTAIRGAMARVEGGAPKIQPALEKALGAGQKSASTISPENYAKAIAVLDALE